MGRFAWELRQCIVSFLYGEREHRRSFPCAHTIRYTYYIIIFFIFISFLVPRLEHSISDRVAKQQRNEMKETEGEGERGSEIDVRVCENDDLNFYAQKLIHRKL